MEMWQLRQRQALPLEAKIAYTQNKIRQWYEHWDGEVYVSFSGGKDSTVLLHLVRQIYPEVVAVFADTGLEFPEIRDFVKTFDNVVWLKPKLNFKEVIEKYGYPVVSKELSQKISEARTTKSDKLRNLRLNGRDGKYGISKRWKYLIDAPFKISDRCCNVMKKISFKSVEKDTAQKGYIGTMTSDSFLRETAYVKRGGCNSFEGNRQQSLPLSIWTETDIWEYLRAYSVPYSPIYDMGYTRTGCMFCAFGAHLEKRPNRFERMKHTHPAQWRYCMKNLGMAEVLDFVGVPCGTKEQLSLWKN